MRALPRPLSLLPLLACLAGGALLPGPARAGVPCGGPLAAFRAGLVAEAVAQGHDPARAQAFFAGLAPDPKVRAADRAQGVFRRDFIDFSRRVISPDRMRRGAEEARRQALTFDRIEAETGVPRAILLAFWALETDYGLVQGDYDTADALFTLAHDCRRPELFRPQLLAALSLAESGDFSPGRSRGAWAGEIGQLQMLPADILAYGTDADGDGHVDLAGSAADALASGAAMLVAHGWQADAPWLQEVSLPETLDWALSGPDRPRPVADWAARGVRPRSGALAAGLQASLLLPMGRQGPAFLAYPNFDVLLRWNQSFVYVTTVAYFATRLAGAPPYAAGRPAPGLDPAQMARLQQRLAALGHDVGPADGILGARTRAAVQLEQARLGLPADAWPTPALLEVLK